MTECVFSPRSRQDLDEIYDYIASDNLDAAGRFIQRIENACQLLASQPKIGKDRSDLRPGLWAFPIGSYIIFYYVQASRIEIVRVIHGMRDLEGVLRPRFK